MAKQENPNFKIVADNRKARFHYTIGDTFEAGIALTGTEVKSLRSGKATIGESYAGEHKGEIFLINCNIPEYLQANRFNHEPKRPRKLLLKMRAARGHDPCAVKTLFQRKRPRQAGIGAGQGQAIARQARDRKEA